MVNYYSELKDNLQVIGINSFERPDSCVYPTLSYPILQDQVMENFEVAWDIFGCQKDDFIFYDKHGDLVGRISHTADNMTDFNAAGDVFNGAFQAVGLSPPTALDAEAAGIDEKYSTALDAEAAEIDEDEAVERNLKARKEMEAKIAAMQAKKYDNLDDDFEQEFLE